MTNEEITKYIFLEDEPIKADIALVFGTWKAWESSVEKAAELYHKKLVPKIIVSGGVNKHTGIVEGNLMADRLIELGVSGLDILIENKSTNTLENVLFSKILIDDVLGMNNIKIVLAVVKNFHARRVLMTLKKQMPSNIVFKIVSYVSPAFNFKKDNWYQSELGCTKVFSEVEKIRKYLANGSLAEIV